MTTPFWGIGAFYRKEMLGYFATPLASVFVAVFVASVGVLTFQIGNVFDVGQADLGPLFVFLPWLLMIFAPALSMQSWAEEATGGTLETLLALPVQIYVIVLAKFLASLSIVGLAFFLTVPIWIALGLLGSVDHLATLIAYFGNFLVAGCFLAIGSAASALASNHVIAFVLGVAICFAVTAIGLPMASDISLYLTGVEMPKILSGWSILDQADAAQKGVLEARSVVFLVSFTAMWLGFTILLVSGRRSR